MAEPNGNPPGRVILGIHSNVDPAGPASLIDGHAWISVNRDGVVTTYGLWPDDHPAIRNSGLSNGDRSDIRRNLETGQPASASRYYALTDAQAKTLEQELGKNVHWGYTYTCASWAGDVTRRTTGERLDTSELLGMTGTPRELSESIREKERQQRTAPEQPLPTDQIKRPSSSLADAGTALDLQQHALAHELRQRLPAAVSDDMVAFTTLKAIQSGIERPEQVRGAVVQGDVVHVAGQIPGMRVSVDPQHAALPERADMGLALQRHAQQQLAQSVPSPDQHLQRNGPRLSA